MNVSSCSMFLFLCVSFTIPSLSSVARHFYLLLSSTLVPLPPPPHFSISSHASSSVYGTSGSENRLWPFGGCVSWCGGEGFTKEMEEEEVEGGQEEKCNSTSHCVLSMYRDWVLSVRRPGCSLLLCLNARFPGGVQFGLEAAEWAWMPGGSFTVAGMTGLRRCSGCLWEESEVEEAQLDREEVELAGVRFGREWRPPRTLGRWARSGLGGQVGLCLLSWRPPRPGGEGRRRGEEEKCLHQRFTQATREAEDKGKIMQPCSLPNMMVKHLIGVEPDVQLMNLERVWACTLEHATHAFTCTHTLLTCTQTNTHKHGCCSSNLLCYRADVNAQSPSLVQTCTIKHRKGPTQWPQWSGQKPAGEWEKRAEGKSPHCTSLLTFRLGAVGGGALLLVQETLGAQRGLGVQVLLVGAGLLHLREATGQVVSAQEEKEDIRGVRCCTSLNTELVTNRTSLLLLFDGLDPFHQVLFSLGVRVQRLVLRNHAEIRTDLLMHLQKTEHHTLKPQLNMSSACYHLCTKYKN